jgi:hypothetical protein
VAADIGRLTASLADRYRIERELGAGSMTTVFEIDSRSRDEQ